MTRPKPTIAEREAIAAVASGRAPLGSTTYLRRACERVEKLAREDERRRIKKALRLVLDNNNGFTTDEALAAVTPKRGTRR